MTEDLKRDIEQAKSLINDNSYLNSLNEKMTYGEFKQWIKFDDSHSKDEEKLENLEIFPCPNINI